MQHRDVLLGAGLTNRPFLRDLAPVAACEPAIWNSPLVRSAGVISADVLAAGSGGPPAAAATAVEVDPQAAFVALAEQLDSYRLAAREHPEAWAAYRAAADLNGPQEVASHGALARPPSPTAMVISGLVGKGLR